MIKCRRLNCVNNYDGECIEVSIHQIEITAEGHCSNYAPEGSPDLDEIQARVSKLLSNTESKLLSGLYSDEDRCIFQGNINALETVLSIISRVKGE